MGGFGGCRSLEACHLVHWGSYLLDGAILCPQKKKKKHIHVGNMGHQELNWNMEATIHQ